MKTSVTASGRKSFRKWPVMAICLAVLAVAAFFSLRPRDRDDLVAAGRPHVRPASVYKPTSRPHRKAIRPALPPRVAEKAVPADADAAEPAADGEAAALDDPPIADGDPALATMAAERDFSALVWASLEESDEVLAMVGFSYLESEEPAKRALGGVMLFFADAFDDDSLGKIVNDEDLSVPLTVFDWVRDFGEGDDADQFRDAMRTRDTSASALFDFAATSASTFGGGRSALDLWLSCFDEENPVPAGDLAKLVSAPEVSYDVREQALFKLLEPETRSAGLAALETFASAIPEDSQDLRGQIARKLRDLTQVSNPDGDECKVWDSEAVVVVYLADAGGALPARDLANYLEYALRRDDPEFPPIIEEGTWEFANEFLEKMLPETETLLPEELDALDRIAASVERLVEYDPAFNPFETVEEGENPEQEFVEEDENGNDGDEGGGPDAEAGNAD